MHKFGVKLIKLTWSRRKIAVTVFVCTILVGSLAGFWQMNQNAQAAMLDPHPGLVGWWRFDEGAGSLAEDSSGNGNDGTVYGALWVDGKYGKALSFNGVDDYMIAPPMGLNLLDSAFTFEAWIKPTYVAPDPSYASLFIVGRFAHIGFSVSPGSSGVFYLKAWVGGYASSYNSGKAWDSWHHIAVVYTGFGSSERKIYVDGTLLATDNSGTVSDFSGTVEVGLASYTAQPSSLIDEVRIYNRVLSAAEIQENFQEKPDFSSKLLAKVPKGATQIFSTVSWQGTGSINVTVESPFESYTEDTVPVYQKTVYSTSGDALSMLNIKRVSISVAALSSDENWYIMLECDEVEDYSISVEVQK